MSAFCRRFGVAAGQAYGQVAGAERIARRRGINHFLFRQLNGRDFPQRLAGNRHQAGVCAALNHHFFNAGGVGAGNHFRNRLLAPQRVFVIEGQERDVGAGQHLLINPLRLLFAAPQTRTIVIIKDNLAAVRPAFPQQGQQLLAAGRAEDRQADAAKIQIIKGRQLFADGRRLLALQPELRRGFVAPVVKGALAALVGFDVVEAR